MPYKDKNKKKEHNRQYKVKFKENNIKRFREYQEEWAEQNKGDRSQYQREYYWANREKEIIRAVRGNKRRYRKLRLEAIEHYGGKCACCGEFRIQFLTIDHINNDGAEHRRELGNRNIYEWLKKNNYPKDGFRVLCYNCNCSIGNYGYCPHELENGDMSAEELCQLEIENYYKNNK